MYSEMFREGNYAPTLGQLEQAGVQIFNDWWDTYVHEHKAVLIKKIMHTYYFEQIGSETPDRFVHYINAHLERIMPYYNQLYKSELERIDPYLNYALEQNGRSIQNLLTKANTSDDRFAKSIRDFAGVTDTAGSAGSVTDATSNVNKEDQGANSYEKKGHEFNTDTDNRVIHEHETDHETAVTDGTVTKKENETNDTDTNTSKDSTTTENPGQVSTNVKQWGATEDGTEKVVGKDTLAGTGAKNWTETLDDDSTTKTVTNSTQNVSSSAEKDYADTPQVQLQTSDDNDKIRKDYLTNVTWDSSNSNTKTNTDQDVTFADDQTKTHKEDTTESSTTDKTADTTTTKKKGGSDTDTTTMSGTNTTDLNATEDTTTYNSRELDGSQKEDKTVTTDGTKDTNTTDDNTSNRNKDWTEDGSSKDSLTSVTDSTGKTTTSSEENKTAQTRENSDTTQSSITNTEKTSEETTDKGTTEITKGFMNVSSSALLEAFRKTFINIDQMIIDDLRDNFMLVY